MSGPAGADVVRRLLEERRLQSVPADRAAAEALLEAAARHLGSARIVADSDPDGAYTMLYDAARKSLAALLQAQGLRATSRGGHVAVQLAIEAQFPDPPPRTAFRPFGRLRVDAVGTDRDQAPAATRRCTCRTDTPIRSAACWVVIRTIRTMSSERRCRSSRLAEVSAHQPVSRRQSEGTSMTARHGPGGGGAVP